VVAIITPTQETTGELLKTSTPPSQNTLYTTTVIATLEPGVIVELNPNSIKSSKKDALNPEDKVATSSAIVLVAM
jgi:hypothetical protein